jgi:hypothetical protein
MSISVLLYTYLSNLCISKLSGLSRIQKKYLNSKENTITDYKLQTDLFENGLAIHSFFPKSEWSAAMLIPFLGCITRN